jgi:hypothetical protein
MGLASTTLRGIVHGKTIELLSELGLPEGQEVTVIVQPNSPLTEADRNAAMLRAFGAWADDAEELDKYLELARQHRKIGRREIEP